MLDILNILARDAMAHPAQAGLMLAALVACLGVPVLCLVAWLEQRAAYRSTETYRIRARFNASRARRA